ncbi:MAG: YihY family inner membrane protein [Candidatus Cloacimonetes bacterium]|nr:YihY family inner membrane protein [Candidatus Cloacimonadota bacterium]MCF7813730.1 YihY family inner membrane protein [Candidatus Cloacimonadota bacterium]MCF7867796.1 YihY family inner membrane protein [Candidatus Cloacimonadota bacterium]MCF7883226.1 YihY family inner membrane protein [Candidatus Cloacimonadota bacterium]
MNKVLDFLKAFWKKYNEDKIFKESAALTYVTLLGFIPFIIFIVFFLPDLPFLKLEDRISELTRSIFVPESAQIIFDYISQMTSKRIPFNTISFVILLFTSYSLFQIINTTFDTILNAREMKSKNFLTEITRFLGMTVFGSLLILVLLSAISLPIVSKFLNIGILQRLSLYVSPFFILTLIFSLGFFYIPTVKVKKRSIVIGAAISATVWILFKSFFNWYISTLTNIELIFGVLGAIPIFLIWIYANWLILLSGVIIVSILEKRHVRRSSKEIDQALVKISFEAVMDKKFIKTRFPNKMKKEDLSALLSELVNNKEPKKSKKQFTEKDS